MENIKIENTWDSDMVHRECKCYSATTTTHCNPVRTKCDRENHEIYCGSNLFTNNLYAIKYPNLIITKTKIIDRNIHLNIFDTIQNKVVFSSKDMFSEENQELIKKNQEDKIKLHCYIGIVYHSTMMIENFMIIKFVVSSGFNNSYTSYIIFNFKTHTYKLFMFCTLYMYNDRTLFVFVTTNGLGNLHNYKITTKYDIENNIDNIMEIVSHKDEDVFMHCMCNSNILILRLIKRVENVQQHSTTKYVYYDIKTQKIVYTNKNQFVGWRGDKLIEYDIELKKCNLISFTSNNIPKKIINCIRCLDKFEESSGEIISKHKNICSLCIINL
jgi:hypothetical protein